MEIPEFAVEFKDYKIWTEMGEMMVYDVAEDKLYFSSEVNHLPDAVECIKVYHQNFDPK